jgi:hypothetical protein
MDNGTDISKIVELIMQNPDIIDRIKKLKNESESGGEGGTKETPKPSADSVGLHKKHGSAKRSALLCALKPYLSEKRGRAIDTVLSVIDVFDLIKGQ